MCALDLFIYIFLYLIPRLEDHVLRAFYARYHSESHRWNRVTGRKHGSVNSGSSDLIYSMSNASKLNPRFYKEGSGSFPEINLV
jgi:hypothetical protein